MVLVQVDMTPMKCWRYHCKCERQANFCIIGTMNMPLVVLYAKRWIYQMMLFGSGNGRERLGRGANDGWRESRLELGE